MTVLDAWSVLVYPLAADRAAFETLFALNLDGVDLPAAAAADVAPSLTVFHAVPLAPEDVRRGLERAESPESDSRRGARGLHRGRSGRVARSRVARLFRRPYPPGPGRVRAQDARLPPRDRSLLRLGEPGGSA